VSNLGADAGELRQVFDVEVRERSGNACRQTVVVQEVPIGLSRRRIAVGDRHAQSRQAAQHLAEGGVLAADQLDVAAAEFIEGDDIPGHGFLAVPLC
jgi:hypothetical protein